MAESIRARLRAAFATSVALLAAWGCDARDPAGPEPTSTPVAQPEPREVGAPPVAELEAQPEPAPDPAPACVLVDPPAGFVDLGARLPSAILAMGYHGPDNFTGAPLPGYEARGAWLEAAAAAALARAAEQLAAEGLRLIIHDAYRPRRASEAMVEWCRANGREDLLAGFVAARSVHNRGRAVDVGLADESGTPLDMGGAWDQFDPISRVRGVDGPALERRLSLRRALVEVGFEPYEREWWHFEYVGRGRAPSRDEPYVCSPPKP